MSDSQSIPNSSIVVYEPDNNHKYPLTLDPDTETAWASQKQASEIFGLSVRAVQEHAQHFQEQDPEAYAKGVRTFRVPTSGGMQDVLHYNLEVMTFIGYRANATPQTVAYRRFVAELVRRHVVARMAVVSKPPDALDAIDFIVAELRASRAQIAELHVKQGELAASVEDINEKLLDSEFLSVLLWCKTQNITEGLKSVALRTKWGKECAEYSRSIGMGIKKAPDEPHIPNRYHVSVLGAVCIPKSKVPKRQLELPNGGGK